MARDQVLQLRAFAEWRQLIDQAAAAEGISRTEFILFSRMPEQTTALLADLKDPGAAARDQASIEWLLAMPQPWHAPA